MRALLVPNPLGDNHKNGIATAQVTAENGARLFADAQYRLDQYRLVEAGAAVELRLPFWLKENLPAAARTIETRIFAQGGAHFRILFLTVIAQNDKPEPNWFPYLLVGEFGIHIGEAIKAAKGKLGCVAYTSPMPVEAGRYRIAPKIAIPSGANGNRDAVAIEAWSGSDLIALGTFNLQNTRPIEIEVEGPDLVLRIFVTSPARFSIRALTVEKAGDVIEPRGRLDLLKLKNWLPFMELGPTACRTTQGVRASRGKDGLVAYGPKWPLATGNYMMLVAVDLDQNDRTSAITWIGLKDLVKASLSFANLFPDGSVDVRLDGKQIAALDRFTIGTYFDRSALLRLPFEIAPGEAGSYRPNLEVRIWSTGRRAFSVRSLVVVNRNGDKQVISPDKSTSHIDGLLNGGT